ncbi:MAG: SpoIIE family protein phosphatase, partial [Planctomycetes bacterium]|nr:SpoIIE family protein phosphatase [Planctomycetota bacterium]
DIVDFITLPNGQTFIIVGDISTVDESAIIPIKTIKPMLRKICRATHDLSDILCQFNKQLHHQYQQDITISCFAAIIDSLDQHLDLCVLNQQPALAARMATGSLLNLIGSPSPCIGQKDGNKFADQLDIINIQAETDDIIALYNNGCIHSQHADFYASFVAAVAGQENIDAQHIAQLLIENISNHQQHDDGSLVIIHFQDDDFI